MDATAPSASVRPASLLREALIAAGIGLVAALIPYHRGLFFPFSLDDYTFLFKAAGLDPAPFEVRRWLTVTAYYELGLKLFGPNTFPWHVVSFLLHAANAGLVYALARRFDVSRNAALIASALFAASPIAFTALYWVACIQEISSTFFVLASIWVAMRTDRYRWLAVPVFAAAVLCKESVMAAPLVLPLLLGRRVLRLAAAQLLTGIVLFFAAGLHQRVFDSDSSLPYATSFGASFLVNLATLFAWFVMPWRAYPDRVVGPQSTLVLPAIGVVGALVVSQLVTRGRTLRPLLLAAAWFVALLLPVLPLKQHTFAYYDYAPQIGFLVLIAIGVERAALWFGRGTRAVAVAGIAVVVLSIVFAERNARLHETLKLQGSNVPHDSIVRYGRAAASLAAAVRSAKASDPNVRHVVFFCFPEQLSTAARTPGRDDPGMVRVRKLPIREALRNGKLVPLHAPELRGEWVDTLSASVEGPETAIFFASGFNDVMRVPDLTQAYALQAQGNLMIGDRRAAERDLQRALEIRPGDGASRLLLAGLRLEEARVDEARPLLAGLRSEDVPEDLRPYLAELRKIIPQ